MERLYLGDGVYVEVINGILKLTAENGVEATDTIYLEPDVAEALFAYYKKIVMRVHDSDYGSCADSDSAW